MLVLLLKTIRMRWCICGRRPPRESFINFLNVLTTSRRKLPFGVAQIGKSFRNEVTPGNFIFRTREFEQMEMEYFVKPGEDEKAHQEWIDACLQWFVDLGVSRQNLRLYEQPKEELAHYAKRTVDIQYRFFPERDDEEKHWDELMGIANRTDFDLRTHSKKPEDAEGKRLNPDSTEDLSYFDETTKERFYPYVIEPAAGVNRTVLALLMDAYSEKTNDKGETRVILKLPAFNGANQSCRPAVGQEQARDCRHGESDQTLAATLAARRVRRHRRHRQALCETRRDWHALLRDCGPSIARRRSGHRARP